jgi:hypothetical protein
MATVDAARKQEKRADDRDLVVPEILDPARRAACEADDEAWLRTYCADVFYNPFTDHQRRIIADCRESFLYGTQKCKAAPRGDGKSSIVKYLALKYTLSRQMLFPLIVAATGDKAKKTLNSLKRRLASRKSTALSEDYPLETTVARYIDPWPSRARNVTANGRRPIYCEWGATWCILPTWEDQDPLGPILMSLGVTSDELQGCNVLDRRPDFVMLDDLDSRDSLASEDGVVAGKIEEVIDKTIAGLGGQNRGLGVFMLCTITSRESAAFKYSSVELKPSFSGERIPALVEWPTRTDLWQQYVELRCYGKQTKDENGRPIDPHGRKAHELYVANFEAMGAGAVPTNPYNFERTLLPDGSQKQLSSLQRCYDYIADYGMPSFLTEHQNDPPEDSGTVESGINTRLIQTQVSGFGQGCVPEVCTVLVHGVDVGKYKLHWVVRAFKPDGTGYTIDYGTHDVYGVKYSSEEGLDRAIKREILRRVAEFRDMDYAKEFRESMTLVDAGYRTEAVYAGCVEAGMGVMPIMGIGLSAGVAERGKFIDAMRRTRDKKPICDGVYIKRIREPGSPAVDLVCASADQFKAWEHDRWMTARDKPGCMFLYGEPSGSPEHLSPDERDHLLYANHICAEVEVEEEHDGAMRRRWKAKSRDNHWLDASYYADVAAAMKGIRVLGKAPVAAPPPAQRPTLQQLSQRR